MSKIKFDDETIMPFGVHKGTKVANIPVSYFEWFRNKNVGKVLYGFYKAFYDYIEEDWTQIEKELADEETNRINRRMLSGR